MFLFAQLIFNTASDRRFLGFLLYYMELSIVNIS